MLLHVDYLKVIISFMRLNVIQATLTSKQCWSAVFPIMLGLALCLQKGHLMTCICSCLLAVRHKVSLLQLCCVLAIFCAVFFSQPSCPQFRAKYVLVSKYSTEQFSVTVPGGGRQQGCHGYLLLRARALPGSTNFVGNSAQAHLLVMSLMVPYKNKYLSNILKILVTPG